MGKIFHIYNADKLLFEYSIWFEIKEGGISTDSNTQLPAFTGQ